MSRGEVLAEVLSTPVLAGLNGRQRLTLQDLPNARDFDGLSSGEWAFLDCCQALHDIERLAPALDEGLRDEVQHAMDALAHDIWRTLDVS